MNSNCFIHTNSYRHPPGTSLIPFNPSEPADTKELLPDLIPPLVVELPSFLTLAARAASTQTQSLGGLQSCHCCKLYTIQFVSGSGFQ